MPGKAVWVEGARCIECPICRTVELPPYSHVTQLLFQSRGLCRQTETEYRNKLNHSRSQIEDLLALNQANRLEAREMRQRMEQHYQAQLEAAKEMSQRMEQHYQAQLEAAQKEIESVKHRLKLKIRQDTQDALPARKSTPEPCNTCFKMTPRTCNVYGCRKHCCMKCVICSDCKQGVAQIR